VFGPDAGGERSREPAGDGLRRRPPDHLKMADERPGEPDRAVVASYFRTADFGPANFAALISQKF
jgi:hypothetical protein